MSANGTRKKMQAWKGNYIAILSDVLINGKAFTALKYILAVMAMLAIGLENTDYYDGFFFFFSGNLGKETL